MKVGSGVYFHEGGGVMTLRKRSKVGKIIREITISQTVESEDQRPTLSMFRNKN